MQFCVTRLSLPVNCEEVYLTVSLPMDTAETEQGEDGLGREAILLWPFSCRVMTDLTHCLVKKEVYFSRHPCDKMQFAMPWNWRGLHHYFLRNIPLCFSESILVVARTAVSDWMKRISLMLGYRQIVFQISTLYWIQEVFFMGKLNQRHSFLYTDLTFYNNFNTEI